MAVTNAGLRITKMSAAADSLPGPLRIQGLKWRSVTGSVIVATDVLTLDCGYEDYASADHLGGEITFDPPLFIGGGESLVISAMTHGALYVIKE